MSTLNQLVDAVLAEVYSDTQTIDASSYLKVSIDADDLAFTVSDGSRFSAGIAEINSELMLIETVDRSSGSVTIAPGGRGVRGTTAASHALAARVTMSPAIARHRVEDAVLETLRASSGLFAVGSTDITYSAATRSYSLPVGVETILSVSWDPGFSLTPEWQPVRRWTHDRHNQALVIGDPVVPGRTVRVAYATSPTVPAMSAEFSTTGLPESCWDVIRFGAAWRVVSFLEPANLLGGAAEAKAMDRPSQGGTRMRVAQYYYQMYQARLNEEVASLQHRYPIRVHFGGTV